MINKLKVFTHFRRQSGQNSTPLLSLSYSSNPD
jgi:hypothetical protein